MDQSWWIEEIDVNNDLENPETNTVFFTNNVAVNIRPDVEGSIKVNEIFLEPFDGIGTKMELAIFLSGTNTVNIYKPIEDDVIEFLNDIKNNENKMSPDVLVGTRRA